jgi:hypothetical protein
MLGDEEMAALEAFFVTQQGALHDFSFTDPWDNVEYPSCSLETDDSFWQFRAESWSQTELVIRENRS